MRINKQTTWLIAAFGFFAFIIWIIYLANSGSGSIFFRIVRSIPLGDKVGHAGLFGVLTFLLIAASQFKTFWLGRLKIYVAVALVLIFVVGEEISQMFIATRTFDLTDLAADMFGIAIATMACARLSQRRGEVST